MDKKKNSALYSLLVIRKFSSCGAGCFIGSDLTLIGSENINIGDNTTIGKHCYLSVWTKKNKCSNDKLYHKPSISIGNFCTIGDYNHITSSYSIKLGNGLLTGRWVTITDNSHGNSDIETLKTRPKNRPIVSKGPVIIGENVWIGEKATIIGPVEIGRGSIIAANAVVTKDVPPYSVVAGIPAKILKTFN